MADVLVDDLRAQLSSGHVLVVVGSGVSVGATRGLPVASWTGLLDAGVSHAEQVARSLPHRWAERRREEIHSGHLNSMLLAAEAVSQELGGVGEFGPWLIKSFRGLTVDDETVIRALLGLGAPIATTNYDGLLEDVSGWVPTTWLNPDQAQRALRRDKEAILHLHGYFEDWRSVVLGVRSYQKLLDHGAAQALQHAVGTLRSLLFVGMGAGLADPNFGALRSWLAARFPDAPYRHFRLCLDDERDAIVAEQAPGERIVPIAYGATHEDLAPFLNSLRSRPHLIGARASSRRLLALDRQSLPTYWWTVREIRSRTPHLTGRADWLANLAAFATGGDPYKVVVGGPWSGKTALLAEAATNGFPDVDIVAYFLTRREADADANRFLAAVVPQLAHLLGEPSPPADKQHFWALWHRAAAAAERRDRHLLLLVDGLDEDLRPSGSPSVAALLPAVAGQRAHVLVSTRPHPELPADLPPSHPLHAVQASLLHPFKGADQLAALARQEIDDLKRRDDGGTAIDVLGILAAAAGPLSVDDLEALAAQPALYSGVLRRRIHSLVQEEAGRSLQAVGPAGHRRYQYAHDSLLAYAERDEDLGHPSFRGRIHRWAEAWRLARWPIASPVGKDTPRYLVDAYPGTVRSEPFRLAALARDAGWVNAALQIQGLDSTLAALRTAHLSCPEDRGVSTMLAAVQGQARALMSPPPGEDRGYYMRQLSMYAAELGSDSLSQAFRKQLDHVPDRGLVPQWTTRRGSPALVAEFGPTDGWTRTISVLSDGRFVVAGHGGGLLAWDPNLNAGEPIRIGHWSSPVGASVSMHDGRVATGSHDGFVLVWNPQVPDVAPSVLGRHTGRVDGVVQLADGRLVTAGKDGRLLIWDPFNPEAGPCSIDVGQKHVRSLSLMPDGRLAVGLEHRLLVVDPQAPRVVLDSGDQGESFRVVVPLLDGRVATGGDRRIRVWDTRGQTIRDPKEIGRHDSTVLALAVLPDGRLVSGSGDRRIRVWSLAADGPGNVLELGRHDRSVRTLAILPDGRVASGGDDHVVRIWDPEAAGTRPIVSTDVRSIRAIAVTADGRILTGGGDARVRLWDPSLPAAVPPKQIGRHDACIMAMAPLLDGRVATSGGDGRIRVWDPAGRCPPVEVGRERQSVRALAALPDGRIASGGAGKAVHLWDVEAPGMAAVELGKHKGAVRAIAVLTDGRLASGGDDGRVLVWDVVAPGAEPFELGRHDGAVRAIAALADARLVSGGEDGRVLMWDVEAPGAKPVALGHHERHVLAVCALGPDLIATSGGDARVRVWEVARFRRVSEVACSTGALAATAAPPGGSVLLAMGLDGGGVSTWTWAG